MAEFGRAPSLPDREVAPSQGRITQVVKYRCNMFLYNDLRMLVTGSLIAMVRPTWAPDSGMFRNGIRNSFPRRRLLYEPRTLAGVGTPIAYRDREL